MEEENGKLVHMNNVVKNSIATSNNNHNKENISNNKTTPNLTTENVENDEISVFSNSNKTVTRTPPKAMAMSITDEITKNTIACEADNGTKKNYLFTLLHPRNPLLTQRKSALIISLIHRKSAALKNYRKCFYSRDLSF